MNSGPAVVHHRRLAGEWRDGRLHGNAVYRRGSGRFAERSGQPQTADQVGEIKKLGLVGSDGTYYDPSCVQARLQIQGVSGPRAGTSFAIRVFSTLTLVSLRTSVFGERFNVQFRTEAFNVTNHPQFGAANGKSGAFASTDVSNANFLRITNSFGERQLRFRFKGQFLG